MKVEATILVPSFHRYYFKLNVNGWKVVPTSGGTKYIKTFGNKVSINDYLSSLEDLNNILVCCFIEDFSPRQIDNFYYKSQDQEEIFKATQVFGNPPRITPSIEELAIRSFNLNSEIFGPSLTNPHYSPNIDLIKEWFTILKANKYLLISLQTLMNSFIIVNSYFSSFGYFDRSKLLDGIILLISSLESIFLHGQDDHSDITFKFSLIGSIYYERFVKNEVIKSFGEQYNKFSRKDFESILKELYRIRSNIAHGQYDKLIKAKDWRKLLIKKSVFYQESFTEVHLFKSISLALCLFEKHIFTLIKGAKNNLLKGINVVDDIIVK